MHSRQFPEMPRPHPILQLRVYTGCVQTVVSIRTRVQPSPSPAVARVADDDADGKQEEEEEVRYTLLF